MTTTSRDYANTIQHAHPQLLHLCQNRVGCRRLEALPDAPRTAEREAQRAGLRGELRVQLPEQRLELAHLLPDGELRSPVRRDRRVLRNDVRDSSHVAALALQLWQRFHERT